MKTIKKLLVLVALSISCATSQAITNAVIAVSGTNVVLAWPSYGYESYLVQYRQTLNATDSWAIATNAYPANSTSLTTFPFPKGTNHTGFFRVFHIPDWLVSFSDYAFDGPTFIPVDFAAPDAPTNQIDGATVLIGGEPDDGTVLIPYDIDGTTYWGMGVYFDEFPNGTNTIQLLTTVRQSDALNDQTPYLVFSNAPQAITISNLITCTNWADLIFSNAYTINAQSSITDVDWEIDIYDVYDDFVNSQTGHSDDGNISWTWDLTDYTGASRFDDNDPFFYPYITITPDSEESGQSGEIQPAAGGSSTRPTHAAANQFPSKGAWLFAYMDNFYDDGTSNYVGADFYYTNAIHTMEGGPAEWSITPYDYPIEYGRNYTQAQRDASWATLKANYLQSWTIRNFYYFGHGGANIIGGDINILDSSNNITSSKNLPGGNAYLTSGWVLGNVLVNKSYGSIPFRFVFLDGCNTAAGSWPVDWGVPKQTETVDYYRSSANKRGARPNAFVGWDVTIGGNKGWGTVDKFWAFREDWMGGWANGFQTHLDDALTQANNDSGWVDQDHFNHLKKYGYTIMMFQEYNNAGDWP